MSITQNITALPTPPTRSEPSTFDDRADAFLSSIPNLADEINLWTGELNATQAEVNTSETSAANSAGAALQSQAAAEQAAASAVNAPGTTATSTTSLSISNGPKVLTIQTGKLFVKGQLVSIASDADPSGSAMYGAIVAHDSVTGSLTVNVSNNVGLGTHNDWVIGLIGSWLPVFYVADELAFVDVTASMTAEPGQRLAVDVSGGVLTVTLPPIVTGSEWVEFSASEGDFSVNPLTVGRNGATIGGLNEDMEVTRNKARFTMIVKNGGWIVI
ncbi:MAG: hypothetical protein AB2604_10545 [Candidatus Thiodiazotropha taylori]